MRGVRNGLGALALAVAAAAPGARADVLYVMDRSANLTAIDPATGMFLSEKQLAIPGKVATHSRGLGVASGGTAYTLVRLGDTCSLDPTRTLFVGNVEYGCEYYGGNTRERCEQSFVVAWDGEPRSCTWLGGCELCMSCVNTCAPPPPCLGSSRTQYAGAEADACRRFDGDASACAAAYFSEELGIGNTATFGCFESGGQCLGCDVAAQVGGACTIDCQPGALCADPARDVFVGTYGCGRLFDDAAACQRAFQTDGNVLAMACFVGSDGYCTWCGPNAEASGFCTNTCAVPAACADPSRAAVPECYARSDDPVGCGQAYMTASNGEPLSCLFNENDVCIPCGDSAQREGKCLNTCKPPVCSEAAERTTVLEPPGDCHALDGDPSGCAAAYFMGPCGVSSCHYDAATGACRPCTLGDPERCENACGAFETDSPVGSTALVAVQLATGDATIVGSPAYWLGEPVADAAGALYAINQLGTCVDEGIVRLDPSDLRPTLVAPFTGASGGALAWHPDGRLYRLAADGLSATDPVTGLTTPITIDAPVYLRAEAMTWAPTCNAFLVADDFDGLWIVDALTGTVAKSVIGLASECDEGDCTTGMVLEGTTVCPPLTFPTFTTTTTSTTTSSSTSTTTLPSELITGDRLLIASAVEKPKKRRLQVRSDDPTITLGGGEGSGDDPTLHGGRLRVVASSGTFAATYPLDGGWRIVRKGGRVKGYAYRGPGAIRKVVLRPGRLDVRGQGADLVQPLLQDPGTVQLILQLGGRRWCLAFGGTFGARTPEKLAARDAPAPPGCGEP